MFSFYKTPGNSNPIERIEVLEDIYSFSFPAVLKEHYLNHDDSLIEERFFEKDGDEYNVARLLSLDDLELLLGEAAEEGESVTMVPFAADWGDDLFCWSIYSQRVYIVYPDDEEATLLFDGISEFFEIMENQ